MGKKSKADVRYVKPGYFMPGVPARDMSFAEWDAVPEWLRIAALEQGIYEFAGSEAPEEIEVESEA